VPHACSFDQWTRHVEVRTHGAMRQQTTATAADRLTNASHTELYMVAKKL